MSERGLILAGDIRLGFFNDSGAFLGYGQDALNVSELTLTPGEGEERDRVSRMRDTFGQALDSVTLPAPWTMTMTTDSILRDILRAMFLGIDQDINVASGSVTGESITAKLGNWLPLEFQNVLASPAVAVTNSAGTVTHVEGTDYQVDLRNGMILPFTSGSITADEALLVNYSYGGKTGFRIDGARAESVRVALLLDGRSLRASDAGKVIRLIVHDVSLRPSGGSDIKSDEWIAPQFTGTLVTPTGQTEPFFYEEYTPSA